MPITLSFDNKVALISGGSRGIGAACVRMFIEAGGRVAFSYQRAREAAERLIAECGAERCAAFQAELSSPEAAADLVRQTVERFGRLDALVANHGIWPPDHLPIDTVPNDLWRRTMAVNLDSVFGLVKHAAAQMKRQGGGSMVLISSASGQRGEAFHTPYAATKGALISMVKGLSTELAADHIRVNCVAPGWVATDMSAPALSNPEFRKEAMALVPLGRPGKPEEIAAPVLFLCTEHAGNIMGEVVNANGGAVLAG
jgi:3-oxoacyl-[acyl-carrier protein] reductase